MLSSRLSIEVDDNPHKFAQNITDQHFIVDDDIRPLTLPLVVDGSTPVSGATYALEGDASSVGLRYANGVLSGTATAGTVTLTYTARDSDGSEVIRQAFTVTVVQAVIPVIARFTFSVNRAVNETLPTATGIAGLTYSLSGNPGWLTLTGNTLSGTPSSTSAAVTVAYIARKNRDEVARQTFTVEVTDSLFDGGDRAEQYLFL